MSLSVFLLVLLAALMHAAWNAWVKSEEDRFGSILRLAAGQSVLAALLLPFFEFPAGHVWPWIAASAALHTGYKAFLIAAYEKGDLSQVYPLARGTAPMIVAAAGMIFLAEVPPPLRLAAVAAIGTGILLMAGGQGRLSGTALLLAMGTAAFTASYTLVDGNGARVSGNASAFILWAIALDGPLMLAYGVAARGASAPFAPLRSGWRQGLAAGATSAGAYWIVVWAFTQAPLAMVAALRETSVLFAMVIAAFLLGEKVAPRRWAAAGLIVAGLVLMRL
ncbi:MAG TPA: EamA family transporter [Allosphingosinicella sp.]|jgi:drug/metabolite transporter (DMT)-like permease